MHFVMTRVPPVASKSSARCAARPLARTVFARARALITHVWDVVLFMSELQPPKSRRNSDGLSQEDRRELLGDYMPYCEIVEQVGRCPQTCRDEKDQPFLDLAQSGGADLRVSGDSEPDMPDMPDMPDITSWEGNSSRPQASPFCHLSVREYATFAASVPASWDLLPY
jgi:hypothetical protein